MKCTHSEHTCKDEETEIKAKSCVRREESANAHLVRALVATVYRMT